ncbi:tubulin monoglutamylase TTLL4 [Eucyclogobius newberryi]|uniref:tubulin monoglutamylase TTLL4 n=1 Tax=Eucyclogobius newberryi TaxID=166745 RepID=UPI003B58F203
MPTNQSYAWGGGQPLSSSGDNCTTNSLSSNAKTVAKVPCSQTSVDQNKRKDLDKPPCLNTLDASLMRHSKACSELESSNRSKSTAKSQITVPDVPPVLPQLSGSPTKSSDPKKENQVSVTMQKHRKLPGNCLQTCREVETRCYTPLKLSHLLSAAHQDLFIRGKPTPQRSNRNVVGSLTSLPSGQPLCLSNSTSQATTVTTDCSINKIPKVEAKCTHEESSKHNQSPRVVSYLSLNDHKSKTADITNNNLQEKSPVVTSLQFCEGDVPFSAATQPDASQRAQTLALDVNSGVLVGSVTNQISSIHLTKHSEAASASHSSLTPSSSTEEYVVDGSLINDPESDMQVDAAEEDLPDELENACSDDDCLDCSSVTDASSTSSITIFSSQCEPMLLGVEDDREEKPALVSSLFPFFPPTLYFSTANEKVEMLPIEQRRLLKWKMSTVTPNIVRNTIARSHFKVTKKSHDWLGCWGHHMKSICFKTVGEHQKLNHFPGTFQIGRKDRLWRNLSKMAARFGKQEFNFFPRTFILPQDIRPLRKAWEDGGTKQKWIIKPPASARGMGIQVIHKWSQMPRRRPLLVQKYLHKPYLISGNKFDLRIYAYVTSYDPLRIYIFSDGLVRFASCKYSSSMKSLGNKFIHLTNYSVNKKNSEYQANSDDKACQGHKWALKALWQYLGAKGINTTPLWEKIKDIVIKTIIASEPYVTSLLKMHLKTPYSCHELFGFDIMLDEKLKPWILEVNISPSLHSNSALDIAIKGQMVRDLLNLAGFHIPQRDVVSAASSSPSSSTSSTSSLCGGHKERGKPDLSADEKVKRAFYLTQRFSDQDFLSSVLDVLTPEDVRVLAESESELTRKGAFERIFPCAASSRYMRFFESQRYLNILLDQWEQRHCSNRTKGINHLRTLCQKGVHLGTNDSAHIWSKCSYISRMEPQKQDFGSSSRSRVVVTHTKRSFEVDDGSDGDVGSVSSAPFSPSPGSSVTSSACVSPQPGLSHSLLPQQFASL